MERRLRALIESYDAGAPLERASTIPAAWYLDADLAALEARGVFGRAWQLACRAEQVAAPGQFVAGELAGGEPIVAVRGGDGELRAFFNVCRHHAAAVVPDGEGRADKLRCPYHGWTYTLEGALRGTPDFSGVCDFDREANGLVPAALASWGPWVMVNPGIFRLKAEATGAQEATGFPDLSHLRLDRLQWVERRTYSVACNWKVFVDNYLDGGYHVPHLHRDLDAALDYGRYRIENGERFCLQSSPTGDGGHAWYYWIYPNLMINVYDNRMDTNIVLPRGIDRTDVVFDFYFDDAARPHAAELIAASERIQDEDVGVCASVQRGLRSRAYDAGRLSVRREAGEHLFHRLLASDLRVALKA